MLLLDRNSTRKAIWSSNHTRLQLGSCLDGRGSCVSAGLSETCRLPCRQLQTASSCDFSFCTSELYFTVKNIKTGKNALRKSRETRMAQRAWCFTSITKKIKQYFLRQKSNLIYRKSCSLSPLIRETRCKTAQVIFHWTKMISQDGIGRAIKSVFVIHNQPTSLTTPYHKYFRLRAGEIAVCLKCLLCKGPRAHVNVRWVQQQPCSSSPGRQR